MPLACSSQRLKKRPASDCLGMARLARSRQLLSVRLASRRASILVNAPTFSLIDMPLSLRITSMSGSMSPPWFMASKAMPAVIAPSPITDTILRLSPRRWLAMAMPSAAEIEVEEWPTPKVSYSLSSRRGNGARPSFFLMRGDAVAAAGEDLVRVALVADVPDQAVVGGVVQVVQGHGQLDHAQARAEMTARAGHRLDQVVAQLVGDGLQLVLRQFAQLRRAVDTGQVRVA